MSLLRVKAGDIVSIGQARHVVLHRTASRELCLRDTSNGAVAQISDADFIDLYMAGKAVIGEPPSEDAAALDAPMDCDFSTRPEKHKRMAYRRQAFIEAIIAAGMPKEKEWPDIIKAVSDRTGLKAYSWSQLKRLVPKYIENGRDIRALLPSFEKCGRRSEFSCDEEENFFNQQLDKHFAPERPSVKHSHDELKVAYAWARENLPGAALWQEPSIQKFRRMIKAVDPFEATRRRHGKQAAIQKFQGVGQGVRALYALEVVEIDHTVGNINIVDDQLGFVLGRPTITIAIDRYTAMIVGLYIGMEPAGTYSVMQCLHNMILPKTYMTREFPELKRGYVDWIAYGTPSKVMVDNAMEFKSGSLLDVGAVIGMTIRYQPLNDPKAKGMVERFMRTIEQSGLTWMPGRTFSNTQERGDYDPSKHACITLRDFRMLFHHWLVTKYCRVYSEKRLDVPERRWREEMENNPPRLPKSKADLDALLGRLFTGQVSRHGIVRFGLRYQSHDLVSLLRLPDFSGTVSYKVHDGDVGSIFVIHPVSGKMFRVPCTDQNYAKGLSLFQHQSIRAFRRQQGLAYEQAASLPEAKAALSALTVEMLQKSRTTNKKALARFLAGSLTAQPATGSIMDFNKTNPTNETILKIIEEDYQEGKEAYLNSVTAAVHLKPEGPYAPPPQLGLAEEDDEITAYEAEAMPGLEDGDLFDEEDDDIVADRLDDDEPPSGDV